MYQNVIEGFLITTIEGLIFEIKGILHPDSRRIAYLRYIPDETGTRSRFGIKYKKITNQTQREQYLEEKYPRYIWFHKNTGRSYQSVPHDRIRFVHDPRRYLHDLKKETKKQNETKEKALTLIDHLIKKTGVKYENLGITGSRLVLLSDTNSDIDLMVFGKKSGVRVYNGISKLFQSKIVIPYGKTTIEDHIHFRWPFLEKYQKQLARIECTKKLQGYFEGTEFFIRMVMYPEEVPFQFDSVFITPLGQKRIKTSIADDSKSIFTPPEYLVSDNSLGIQKIISYRSRFCEHVKKGDFVEAYGRLEEVRYNRERVVKRQLVLGESPHDYLLPI
ncbi:MAG: hypothetical protein BAJATHORv1_20443 [Candidatus Thorarchaeota archaeon]|nr:MAG: hypothetical protein BAJATHORv1_20443 [Candidatus Thorarchaeota archaeon]